jgi:hypothetical protein
MPENPSQTPPPANPPKSAAAAASRPDAGHIPITEELDSAKWTLPPIVPLLIAAVLVAVVVSVVVFSNRSTPGASLALIKVASSAQEGNTMVAIQARLENQIEKPLWVKSISAEVETAEGKKYSDNAAPSTDAASYMQAFPPLQEAKADWLKEELKIPARGSYNGVAIFAFPLAQKDFDARKNLTLRIQFYDRPTLMATSPAAAKP